MVFLRRYATPLSVVAFFVVGITGLLMFFGVRGRVMNEVHEWFGIAFVAVGLLHVVRNGEAFLGLFRQTRALVLMAILGTVSVLMLAWALGTAGGHGPGHGPHHGQDSRPPATTAPGGGHL